MRLNVKTREGIIRAFATTLGPQIWNEQLVTLMLFGSRTRPELKGGDIDLLLLVDSSILKKIQDQKRSLLTALEKISEKGA